MLRHPVRSVRRAYVEHEPGRRRDGCFVMPMGCVGPGDEQDYGRGIANLAILERILQRLRGRLPHLHAGIPERTCWTPALAALHMRHNVGILPD
ncbi:MAG: hypothetical protein MUQ10_07980 [Anaerolineae bacterium]|nr:hypothetical protein [Anaerolineae bacterium]